MNISSAAEVTFAQLGKTPGMGKVTQLVVSTLGEIRQWRIKDFQDYLIFYRIQDTTIEILRIFHELLHQGLCRGLEKKGIMFFISINKLRSLCH